MKFGKSMLLAAFLAVGGAVAGDEAKADIGVWPKWAARKAKNP